MRLSRTDPLTGIENRRAIDDRLRDLWEAWQQKGQTFAAILIDVDFFKRFNDRYGHQQGDQCLRMVAEVLQNAAPPHVTIGRYGGEEFIVLASLNSSEQALELAEGLRQAVESMALRHEERRAAVRT